MKKNFLDAMKAMFDKNLSAVEEPDLFPPGVSGSK